MKITMILEKRRAPSENVFRKGPMSEVSYPRLVQDQNVAVGQNVAMDGLRPNPPQQAERTHVAVAELRGSLIHDRVRQLGLEGAEIEVEHRFLVAVHRGLTDDRLEPLHCTVQTEAEHFRVAEVCRNYPSEGGTQVGRGTVVEAVVGVHDTDLGAVVEHSDAQVDLVATPLVDGRPHVAAHLRQVHGAELDRRVLVGVRVANTDCAGDDDVLEAEPFQVLPKRLVQRRRLSVPRRSDNLQLLTLESPLGRLRASRASLGVEHQTVALLRHLGVAFRSIVEMEEDIAAVVRLDEAEQLVGTVVKELHCTRFHRKPPSFTHSFANSPSGIPLSSARHRALMVYEILAYSTLKVKPKQKISIPAVL